MPCCVGVAVAEGFGVGFGVVFAGVGVGVSLGGVVDVGEAGGNPVVSAGEGDTATDPPRPGALFGAAAP
jgi:hypothetical protein